jgi:predicted ArsR family transcriptional regulator
MSPAPDDPALTSVSCLSDPVRRQLYDFVAGSPEPVGRDEAAAAAGIGRAIAVYHLDKLVESGLLTASYRRPGGRGGPGAGRPAKFYARSTREFTVTVPAREYELAAHLLARAVAADEGGASQAALRAAARQFGEDAAAGYLAAGQDAGGASFAGATPEGASVAGATPGGASVAGTTPYDSDAARVAAVLRAHGFEPRPAADGTVVLHNCPFHRLAADHRNIVCGMNLALIEGLVEGLGASGLRPVLDPGPGQCCVVIGAGQPPAETATTGER